MQTFCVHRRIIGFSELLSETYLNTYQMEFVRSVRQSADDLLTIINDILDFSKVETGKVELECREFNIEESISR